MSLILVTERDWFASALEGVLGAEDIQLQRVAALEELADLLRSGPVEAVILDASVAGEGTSGAIRDLLAGPLSEDVPLVVYSSGFADESLSAEFIDAGAWDVIEGPVRSAYFVSVLRRFLEISERHGRGRENATGNGAAELPDLEGLLDRLPVLEALAKREQACIAIMAIAPTGEIRGEAGSTQGTRVADLCLDGLRKSDLCGWLDAGEELVVVAYSATREGARVVAERLAEKAADRLEARKPTEALSAGIVEIRPEDLPDHIRAADRAEAQVEFLSRAREALARARREGGGVRFAP